jgi:hypothetical protein
VKSSIYSDTDESRGEDDDLDLPPHRSREPPQSTQPQGGVTKEDLSEPLPELSDQLGQSRLDEEDTQAAVEEVRHGKARAHDTQTRRYNCSKGHNIAPPVVHSFLADS